MNNEVIPRLRSTATCMCDWVSREWPSQAQAQREWHDHWLTAHCGMVVLQ